MSTAPDTYKICRPAALHPILCSHITSKNPPLLPPFPSVTLSLSRSIISVHPSLVGASQRGLGCCMRGILGLWRQFGNEARLHLNTLLSGHLVNLMRGGWREWRGEVERMEGSEERERERESKGSNCNTKRERERGTEEREGSEGGSVWRTPANINSLCKSAAQTNWQAGITPERSWIKSMKALAPLTLDLQPRPVNRSVPVMHTNDSGGASRTVTSQHILFSYSGSWRRNPSSYILHPRWNVNYAGRKTRECFLTELDPHTDTVCSSRRRRLCFLSIPEKNIWIPNPGSKSAQSALQRARRKREDWEDMRQRFQNWSFHCSTISLSPATQMFFS